MMPYDTIFIAALSYGSHMTLTVLHKSVANMIRSLAPTGAQPFAVYQLMWLGKI